ncbi:MAG TPA: hypothetical protein VGA04_10500 [Streptosporangiaceae bacterium]
MTLTLGDAFNRRKKLAADLQNWINRLGLAGTERRSYRTATLDGDDAYQVTDFGVARREQWDAIDRIGEFAQRVKQAINQANKTELAELD